MEHQSFNEMNLAAPIFRAVMAKNYKQPTPIQSAAIPHLIAGRDLIGCAQTGTGKTAAFALPILQKILTERRKSRPHTARVLVLTPTRELAAQVDNSFKTYGKFLGLSHALIFGGVNQYPQVKALSRGADIIVATPGRLLDLMRQKHLSLSGIEIFVLDEADRMLDMGFMPDIEKIIAALPPKRQALLFSATMAPEIRKIAEKLLKDPVSIAVSPPASTVENVNEQLFFVNDLNKRDLLSEVLKSPEVERTLIFTRTKNGANKLTRHLGERACAIHGDKSQSARMSALKDFKTGRCCILVATDIASRGIDVTGITHVINYDMPIEPEIYIHRIGRTARAGAYGKAISFCGYGELLHLRHIERLLKRPIPVTKDHPYHFEPAMNAVSGTSTSFRNHNRRNRKTNTLSRRCRKGGERKWK